MTLSFLISNWYDCVLRCTFICTSHCLNFSLILSNWFDFSIFKFCCCFWNFSCSMHICICSIILAELLVSFIVLDAELEMLNIMIFIFFQVSLFYFRIIFFLILDDFFSSLTLFWNVCIRAASVMKLLSLFQQIKVVEIYHHKMFLMI